LAVSMSRNFAFQLFSALVTRLKWAHFCSDLLAHCLTSLLFSCRLCDLRFIVCRLQFPGVKSEYEVKFYIQLVL